MNTASGASGGGGSDTIWDEELSHLLNSPEHGGLPWLPAVPNGGLTRKDIGRLSSFDLAEMNHQTTTTAPAMTSQDISYERKKSRAKITRVEVNNGFDELLQVLRLPSSRKNSRAKVIQYACERIRQLEQENERLKQQMPQMPPANPGAMVWIPCSLAPAPILIPQIRVPPRTVKKPRKSSKHTPTSSLHTLVDNSPQLMRFFDASTLAQLMLVSTDWKNFICDAKQSYLWEALIKARWHVSDEELHQLAPGTMRHKWIQLHKTMLIPRGLYSFESVQDKCTSIVARGRSRRIDVWGLLARRSNSRTTRSVWRDGTITVMQLVELRLVIQNLSSDPIRVDTSSVSVWPFHVLDCSYGTLFEPRWIAFNGDKSIPDQVVLKHMDFGVMSVYVSCPHVEFEEVFLSRARSIQVTCRSLHSKATAVEASFLPPSTVNYPKEYDRSLV